jgi:hypothetical protein
VQKSNIENINAYWNSAVSIFRLNNQELEEIPIFTYLGMLLDEHRILPCCVPCFEAF